MRNNEGFDNYVQYSYTACELAKVDKWHRLIEIVKNKNKNKKLESIANLLD